MTSKVKNTPAYVEKAIKWLEKNAPDGEQIAFINDEEAALLKSRGGSGEEVIDGVRSYEADRDSSDIQKQLEEQANKDYINQLRLDQEAEDAAATAEEEEEEEADPAFAIRRGGAEAVRLAEQTTPSELAIPTIPTAPTMQVASMGDATEDQLISDQGLEIAATPQSVEAETVDPTDLSPTAPTRVDAATMQATQVADTGQATAAQLAAPTRTIGDIQGATPAEELAQAATADLDQKATLKFQLGEITSSIKDGQPLPLWAAPAARNADGLMLQRGLGASSMAASARTQALLEAGIPIASADAQAYGRIQLANLSNKQAAALQNANTLAAMRTQNLNNRMTAAVNNAQNFLAIDTANLSNKQASNTLTFQANQQKLFTNQAAENAAKQFNATSENQVEQFFASLDSSVTQANANRLTAVRQFNAGETNSQNQFLENQRLSRETFNSQVQSSVRAANSNWFKSLATINNSNQMLANSFAAQSALNLSSLEYQALWQKRRDDANFIFSAEESFLNRGANMAIAAQNASIARGAAKSQNTSSLMSTLGVVATAVISNIWSGSDIRLKTNIEKIGELNATINLYRWEWNEVAEKMGVDNQPSVGVLAQELIEYRPDLVMMHDDGYFRVNYSGLLG